ncbi:MAG: hypothetical protein ACFB0D_16205 [Phormidesmis sp.]
MTTTKAELEEILSPLGDDPAAAIADLQRQAKELEFLKSILPNIIAKGAIATLHEHPAPIEPCLSWHSMSNDQLSNEPSDESDPGAFEKMRRAFLGVQEYNSSAAPEQQLYPLLTMLNELAGVDIEIARKWLKAQHSDVSAYVDGLAPGLRDENEQYKHNRMVLSHSDFKHFSQLVSWPTAYD